MRDFNNVFTYSNGQAFPATKAVDSSGGGAKDGTEYKAAFVDEILGFFQAALSQGGLTPSGSSDIATASQILDGIRNSIVKTAQLNAKLYLCNNVGLGIFPLVFEAPYIPVTLMKIGDLFAIRADDVAGTFSSNGAGVGDDYYGVTMQFVESVPTWWTPETHEPVVGNIREFGEYNTAVITTGNSNYDVLFRFLGFQILPPGVTFSVNGFCATL